jgi:hypothetical protein
LPEPENEETVPSAGAAPESGASIRETVFQHVVRENGDDAESA